jgi:hypothetical protein
MPHDINEQNEDKFTVLMVAAAMGRHDMVSLLLKVCVSVCGMHMYACTIYICFYSYCSDGQA